MLDLDEARNHIGDAVIYREGPGGLIEQGFITSVNAFYVFVRYGSDGGSKATRPQDLTLLADATQQKG